MARLWLRCTLGSGFSSNAEFITAIAVAYAAADYAVIEGEDLPPICLDRRAVKNSRGHNRASVRIAAFAAVPEGETLSCPDSLPA